jgi:hypothetical protein
MRPVAVTWLRYRAVPEPRSLSQNCDSAAIRTAKCPPSLELAVMSELGERHLMNTYRRTAIAVTTCAAGLSLAACSVGITTAKPGTSPSPSVSHSGSSPTTPSTPPASPKSSPSPVATATVAVSAPIGSFPIPPGAKVLYNFSCSKQISIMVGPVTPSESSTFYTSALPRAGYKIDDDFTTSDPNTGAADGLTDIDFSGHDYQGSIATADNLAAEASADPSAPSVGTLPSDMTKNVEQVFMTLDGTPSSYICPN